MASGKSATERVVSAEHVRARSPDIIIGSWCGKKFNAAKLAGRPGFETIPAVRNQRLHEIKSTLILQPGPAALTDGLRALERVIQGESESR
jgi:iron complex transport system substrate-binding protein